MSEKQPEVHVTREGSVETAKTDTHQIPDQQPSVEEVSKWNTKEEQRKSRIKEVWEMLQREVGPVFRKRQEVIPPIENIKYYPDRMYRCIGKGGYEDFLATGFVRSKDNQKYLDVSFNLGGPSPLYLLKEAGNYILEALPDAANFEPKTHPFFGTPMTDIDYRGVQKGELTKDSKIRIFEKQQTGKYAVVFDNIGDQALHE